MVVSRREGYVGNIGSWDRVFLDTHLTRFASFSSGRIAETSAAARSAGCAFTSQILLDFNGPFTQSGPIAPCAAGSRAASVVSTIVDNMMVKEQDNSMGVLHASTGSAFI